MLKGRALARAISAAIKEKYKQNQKPIVPEMQAGTLLFT